jgi:hypothetical protein
VDFRKRSYYFKLPGRKSFVITPKSYSKFFSPFDGFGKFFQNIG